MMALLRWNPTIPWLLVLQGQARTRRMLQGFSTPRRLLLSSLGIMLAFVYLGQAAISMWLREPMEPGRLREMVPLALLAYVLWDVLHVAWHRPKHGMRFRPAERQQLGMAPLQREDLVRYRLLAIAAASLLKAAVFCLVMVADLPLWPMSFLGAALALAFVDQSRLLIATCVEGMTPGVYRRFRWCVMAIAAAVALSAVVIALCADDPLPQHSFVASVNLVMRTGQALTQLADTWVGQVLQLPLTAYGHLIAVQEVSWLYVGWWTTALALNMGLALALLRLDERVQRTLRWRERKQFRMRDHAQVADARSRSAQDSFVSLPGQAAWTAIAWRQLHSARQYWPNLLLALAAPAGLSLMPLLLDHSRDETFFAIMGSVTFYTFLLLPAALKFDFRRDVDRIVAIKLLPLAPSQIVGAQLFAPWVIASLFHLAVIAIAQIATGVPWTHGAAALAVLLPISLLCFALDNLIFLMYPHRLREEGLVMFVRTTLTFTAKGMFFGLALALVAAWAYLARAAAAWMSVDTLSLFVTGISLFLVATNAIVLRLMVSAYRHFDISWDRPA
jgi:hypothetical protein